MASPSLTSLGQSLRYEGKYANRMPGHRPEDQVDFLSFAENADADEGKNLRKWGKGDTPGYGGGRNAFLTSPKNSWYGEDMTPGRKPALAREWISFALSFGLGGHIAQIGRASCRERV